MVFPFNVRSVDYLSFPSDSVIICTQTFFLVMLVFLYVLLTLRAF
jgi:hypothetical protein